MRTTCQVCGRIKISIRVQKFLRMNMYPAEEMGKHYFFSCLDGSRYEPIEYIESNDFLDCKNLNYQIIEKIEKKY